MKTLLTEFRSFISRGNVLDLAVGVIIGAAFSKIVTSLVNDILMPAVGSLLGGTNLSALSWHIGDATIAYGAFLQSILDFLIIAASIFLFIKLISRIMKPSSPLIVSDKKLTQKESAELKVLREIRDSLKK